MHCEHEHKVERKNLKILAIVLLITLGYMIAEVVGGYIANSLALLADAGHMLSDAAGLGLSFFALWISFKPADEKKTYGYYRAEILSAFINGVTLVLISLFIIYEAYQRFFHPFNVNPYILISVAFGGLLINILAAFLLHKSSHENLNIHGAFLHVISDLFGSLAAIIAGIGILVAKWYLLDPILSILIAVLILFSASKLIVEAINVLLEASPSHINIEAIRSELMKLQYVEDVYDLHVWSISTHKIALSVHIVSNNPHTNDILCNSSKVIAEKFGIDHSTIQIEPVGFDEKECRL